MTDVFELEPLAKAFLSVAGYPAISGLYLGIDQGSIIEKIMKGMNAEEAKSLLNRNRTPTMWAEFFCEAAARQGLSNELANELITPFGRLRGADHSAVSTLYEINKPHFAKVVELSLQPKTHTP
jgi:hypothetical protein